MRRPTMIAAGLALLAAVPASAQQPADAALPAARDVVSRYVEAMGGEAALRRQQSHHMRGRIEMPSQGLGGDIEVFSAAPNKLLVRTEIAGMGLIRTGYDGTVAWSIHPAMGPMVLDGRMRDQMRHQSDFLAPLQPERLVKSLETVARTTFEGRPVYKVRVVTQWDEEYFEFFDTETGLMVGIVRQQATPMGDIETTTVLSDYKELDGLLIPTRSVQRLLGMEQVVTVATMEANTVDGTVFALPPEIAALLAR